MMKRVLAIAAVIAGLAGAAHAEVNMTTSLGFENVNSSVGDYSIDGIKVGVDGAHKSGLKYNVKLMAGDIAGASALSAELDARYNFLGYAGVAARSQYGRVAGVSDNRTWLGLSGSYAYKGVEFDGALLGDVDSADNYLASIGASYQLGNVKLLGAIDHYDQRAVLGGNLTTYELKSRYEFREGVFMEGGLSHGTSKHHNSNAVTLGMGFRF